MRPAPLRRAFQQPKEIVMHFRHRLSLVLMSFTLAGAAWAYPEYKVTVVGPANSTAADINNAGVVVGYYPYSPTANHAFLNRGKGLASRSTWAR